MTRAQPRQGHVRANGLRFAYLEQGPADGPLVLLLHGFPDHAWTWQYQLPALADAGWRAVAPWMRGYHPTEVPKDLRIPPGLLATDANALHAALGGDGRAVIVGHDWGAIATYGAASTAAQRWSRVVTLAVPPGAALLPRALVDPSQLRRSWYIGFFQLPVLPERFIGSDHFTRIDHLWRAAWRGYRDDPHFREQLRTTFTHPRTLAAALGYYRSAANPLARRQAPAASNAAVARVPAQPLLYLHGRRDGAIGVAYAERARDVVTRPGSRVEILDDCGHFLHLERPEEVNRLLLDFLGAPPAR